MQFQDIEKGSFSLQKGNFSTSEEPHLHCNSSRFAKQKGFLAFQKYSIWIARKPFLTKNTASATSVTYKKRLRKLQNRFFVCNRFLLHVRYLYVEGWVTFLNVLSVICTLLMFLLQSIHLIITINSANRLTHY